MHDHMHLCIRRCICASTCASVHQHVHPYICAVTCAFVNLCSNMCICTTVHQHMHLCICASTHAQPVLQDAVLLHVKLCFASHSTPDPLCCFPSKLRQTLTLPGSPNILQPCGFLQSMLKGAVLLFSSLSKSSLALSAALSSCGQTDGPHVDGTRAQTGPNVQHSDKSDWASRLGGRAEAYPWRTRPGAVGDPAHGSCLSPCRCALCNFPLCFPLPDFDFRILFPVSSAYPFLFVHSVVITQNKAGHQGFGTVAQ